MKQALHIFAKDARHFWPEITVSLVITAVFAWTYRYTWMADMVPGIPKLQYLQKLAEIVAGLVPVSWWILITRAVHAETVSYTHLDVYKRQLQERDLIRFPP